MTKREKIALLSLTGVALCLILLYFLVFAPMLYEQQATSILPEIEEGEGIYLNTYVTLYPEISSADVLSIDVENEHGSYGFYVTENKNGVKQTVIKGHENLKYSELVYAYLLAYTRLPVVPQDTNIYRDVEPEKMAEYGLTEDTCTVKYTVKYNSNGEEKSHTVLIGKKIMASTNIYYATVQGRDNVYTMNGAGIEGSMIKPLPSYVSPLIYQNFNSAAAAATKINNFALYLTPTDGSNELDYVLLLEKDKSESTDTGSTYYMTCKKIYPQKVMASSLYITNAFGQLFTSFTGEETVAIVPDLPVKPVRKDHADLTDEQFDALIKEYESEYALAFAERQRVLSEYGLGDADEHFMVYAKGDYSSTDAIAIHISKAKDDYYYVLSEYYAQDIIVSVPCENLSFLGEGEETALKWAATNSVYAGFSEYLVVDDPMDENSKKVFVEEITIKTKGSGINYGGYDYTFTVEKVEPAQGKSYFVIKSTDGSLVYSTKDNSPDGGIDLFSTLYAVLIVMPKPQAFSVLTPEQKQEITIEENLVYSLEVRLESGVCKKYEYYFINSGYALCVSSIGHVEGSEYVYTRTESVFETSMSHISSVAQAYEKTIKGEHYIQNDYIS